MYLFITLLHGFCFIFFLLKIVKYPIYMYIFFVHTEVIQKSVLHGQHGEKDSNSATYHGHD